MKSQKQAAVVIPFYKKNLTELEKISLSQCLKVLYKFPVIIVKPQSLDLISTEYENLVSDVISFDDKYFDGIKGYNELMLSADFYQKFLQYDFILVHQLDAFVFRDELRFWCNQGYDYIGAPWLKRLASPDFIKAWKTIINTRYHIFFNTYEDGLPSNRQFDNMVGNGGFSLRQVRKFYDLCIKFDTKIQEYHQQDDHRFHEDVFWSIEVNRRSRNLRIPAFKKALLFSFENRLEQSMQHTGNQIPFGCHAWDQHLDFWRPYFAKLGYQLPESQI